MLVKIAKPPLYDELVRFFGIGEHDEVFFTFGDVVYNPTGVKIPPAIMAHEMVHRDRQAGDVMGWWRRYIDDPAFRLAEEIPAHQAEWRHLKETMDRNRAAPLLAFIARRLSGPVYGNLISYRDAMRIVRA